MGGIEMSSSAMMKICRKTATVGYTLFVGSNAVCGLVHGCHEHIKWLNTIRPIKVKYPLFEPAVNGIRETSMWWWLIGKHGTLCGLTASVAPISFPLLMILSIDPRDIKP